jgi:hypothetical protein
MIGGAGGRDKENRSIESIVNGAMGQSVTPSQLQGSNSVGFFRRLIGNEPVEGPFTKDIEVNEQAHYLLYSTGFLLFPQEDDEFKDNLFSIRDQSIISPVVLMVTDKRSLFIYGNGDSRRVISLAHEDIINIDFNDLKVEKELNIQTTQRKLEFGMWTTDPYAGEVSDAAAYIFEQSEAEGGYQEYDFDSGDYTSAKSSLKEQFERIQEFSEQIDVEYVASCAAKGAKIGAYRRNPYAAGLGFLLGAGYGIWSDIGPKDQKKNPADDIDPERTAEIMLHWQQAGKIHNRRGVELASGAVGAAVAIDEQTSGRRVSSALAELDVEWVSRQLESGEEAKAGIQVASEVVESYSTELAELLNQDFFDQLRK